ncbi:hypothetical protein IJ707_07360 [bacterium]|nr:hypothetical protein [bacterium]
MEFFEFTKKLLKLKKENQTKDYTTNPFKQNKQVTFIWVEPKKNGDLP